MVLCWTSLLPPGILLIFFAVQRKVKLCSAGASNPSLGSRAGQGRGGEQGVSCELTVELLQKAISWCNEECIFALLENAEIMSFIIRIMERCMKSMQMTPAARNILPCCQGTVLLCVFPPVSWSPFKRNASEDIPEVAFFPLSVVPLHVVWLQRHFLWLPQAWSFLRATEVSLGRALRSCSGCCKSIHSRCAIFRPYFGGDHPSHGTEKNPRYSPHVIQHWVKKKNQD